MKLFKRISTVSLSLLLAMLMSFLTPVNCIAAENAQVYISEMKMGYGDDGKAALEAAGYSILKGSDSGDGVLGSSVWIGYKTTSNAKEAITDISVMNMNGGYSVEKYREELKQLNQTVTKKLTEFKKAVAEFSSYYKKGSEYAKTAYDILSRFIEDDSGKNLAEIFTAGSPDNDILHRVFMEGNAEIIDVVEGAVALGLTEVDGNTFIDRLADEEYSNEIEVRYNADRNILADAFEVFKTVIASAASVYKTASEYKSEDGTKTGVNAYLETKSGSDLREKAYYVYLYEAANKVTFGNTGSTLYQLATYTASEENDEEEGEERLLEMDAYAIDMLRRSMTVGQIGVVGSAGLASLITSAYSSKEKPAEGSRITSSLATINSYIKDYITEGLSVYTDVDRSLFSGDGDIAITDSAQREKALSNSSNFGRKASDNTKYRIALASMAGLSGAIAVGCGATALVMRESYLRTVGVDVTQYVFNYYDNGYFAGEGFASSRDSFLNAFQKDLTMTYNSKEEAAARLQEILNSDKYKGLFADNMDLEEFTGIIEDELFVQKTEIRGEELKKCCFGDYSTKLNIGLTVVAAVAFIATVTLIVLSILAYKNKPQTENIKYTAIPRVIIDKVSDSQNVASYYPFYAVKQITATDSEKDSLKLYGDLNGFNNTDEWFVLYTSKDSRLGSPLTPEVLVKSTDEGLSNAQFGKYKAVHTFGTVGAVDLNSYNTGNKSEIYLYFKTENSATATQTGSLFNVENGIICLSCLLVGALVAFAIAYYPAKRKQTEN